MTEQLLPCPFCGPEHIVTVSRQGRSKCVACRNADCPLTYAEFTPEQWNTRVKQDDGQTYSCPVCDERAQKEKGYVLVPRVPTERMICAGIEAYQGACEQSYKAMIEAAQGEKSDGQ